VLTIRKSGRANRLTFEDLESDDISQLISALEEVKAQLSAIEEDKGDFDIDLIESGSTDS
jgi:hypothetical protein